jgi:hypothetical protein
MRCPKCEITTEVFCRIENRDKQRCACGTRMERIVSAPAIKPDDCDWSCENNGKGRYNPQTRMHHRTRRDVVEEAKRRNWDYSFG